MDELLREMVEPAPSPSDVARRRRLISSIVILGLAVVGITVLSTSALFTDNDTVTSNAITTGSVDLTAGNLVLLQSGDLAPGDSTFAEVTVTNSGSLAYRYAIRYQASDVDTEPGTATHTPDTGSPAITEAQLSSQLRLRVYAHVSCTADGTDAVTSNPGGDAPALLTSVGNTDGVGALSTADWAPLVGDVAPLAQPGDRQLSSTASETLCVRIDLSSGAANQYQNTSSTVSLRFDAEQTTNNT